MTRAFSSQLLSVLLIFSAMLCAQETKVLNLSHDSAVRIISPSHGLSGSGFVVGDQYIATCLHVVASVQLDGGNNAQIAVFRDLKITMASGEIIDGDVISIPTDQEQEPLYYDFAFVKLRHKPTKEFSIVKFATEAEQLKIGDDVAFSGYPLTAPGMTTLRGMVSGFNDGRDLIIVQAPINKGNSGGALINRDGHVVGLISMREGGINQGLAELRQQIIASRQNGSVRTMGVDTFAATQGLIDTLDEYISTGIGYARSIQFARSYMQKHPELFK